MTDSIRHAWGILARSDPAEDRLESKQIYAELTSKLSCAVDAVGQRHLLILLSDTDEELTDTQSRGLSVVTRELRVAGADPKKYIDVVCQDPSGHPAFDSLIEDVANTLGSTNLSPSAATSRVLEKWRRFWSKLIGNHLGRVEQIGLFAELWFLFKWLVPVKGVEMVHSWQGPFGYINDFEGESFNVEVKATTSGRGHVYHINGIDQLENPKNGTLYLFGVRLSETKSQGQSISALVSEIREQLTDQHKALSHLEDGLANAGYSDVHAEIHDQMKFKIRDERLFEVKKDFPKLDKNLIQIPPGVERIEYEINLNTFDHLIVANSPAEWTF